MVRKGKEGMTSVRKSSLRRSERPDEPVKPVSVITRIVWVVVTAPFTLLSLVLAVGCVDIVMRAKSGIDVLGGLLGMLLSLTVVPSFTAIAFFPSKWIRNPSRRMKYWYRGWLYGGLVCLFVLPLVYPFIERLISFFF